MGGDSCAGSLRIAADGQVQAHGALAEHAADEVVSCIRRRRDVRAVQEAGEAGTLQRRRPMEGNFAAKSEMQPPYEVPVGLASLLSPEPGCPRRSSHF